MQKKGGRMGPALPAPRLRLLLLLGSLFRGYATDGFLGGFGNAELHHLLGGDFDRFAGGRVATHASLAVHQYQLTEAGKGKTVFGMLVSQTGLGVEESADLNLG